MYMVHAIFPFFFGSPLSHPCPQLHRCTYAWSRFNTTLRVPCPLSFGDSRPPQDGVAAAKIEYMQAAETRQTPPRLAAFGAYTQLADVHIYSNSASAASSPDVHRKSRRRTRAGSERNN